MRQIIKVYEGWARRLLPSVEFPVFVQQVEHLSGKQQLQVKQMHLDQGYDDNWADADVHADTV